MIAQRRRLRLSRVRPIVRNLIGLAGFFAASGRRPSGSGLVAADLLPPPSERGRRRLVELLGDAVVPARRDRDRAGLADRAGHRDRDRRAGRAAARQRARPCGAATRALVEFLRPIPSVALIPLVIVLLGSRPGDQDHARGVRGGLADPVQHHLRAGRDRPAAAWRPPARSAPAGPRVLTTVGAAARARRSCSPESGSSAAIALIVVVSTEFLAGSAGGIGAVHHWTARSGGGRMDQVLAGDRGRRRDRLPDQRRPGTRSAGGWFRLERPVTRGALR